MVGVERRVHILRVGLAIRRLRSYHCLDIVRSRIASGHDRTNDALGISKREIKERINATCVQCRDGSTVCPGLPHQIAVRVDALAGLSQIAQEVDVAFRASRHVGGHGVQSEAVHALVEPEAHDVGNLITDHLVAQIEVRHLRPEACLVIPRRSLQRNEAVIGLSREDVVPHVRTVLEHRVLVGRKRAQVVRCRAEPRMRIGGVIKHQIKQDAHPTCVTLLKQGLIVLHRPEAGVNRTVVIHVVFVIGVRGMHRGQPQLVKAHVADVVQLFANTVQIPDAIAV